MTAKDRDQQTFKVKLLKVLTIKYLCQDHPRVL